MRICTKCYDFIHKLEEFDQRCANVDKLFSKITSFVQPDADLLKALRREAGLDDNVCNAFTFIYQISNLFSISNRMHRYQKFLK